MGSARRARWGWARECRGCPHAAQRRNVSNSITGGGKLSGEIENPRMRRVAIVVGAPKLPTKFFFWGGALGALLAALLLGGLGAV